MSDASRTILATATVAVAGIGALAGVTHGFQTATREEARRLEVRQAPVWVPEVQGIDQAGKVHGLFDDVSSGRRHPRVAIVAFIYTRCVEVCSASGSSLQYLQREIQTRHLDDRVRLVSVSFDPSHDTPAVLALYARKRASVLNVWTIETPLVASQVPALMKAFGVIVLETPSGDFEHNAAFELIDTTGRLARIVDLETPDRALAQALELAASAKH